MWRFQYYRYRFLRYLHHKLDDEVSRGRFPNYDAVLRAWLWNFLALALLATICGWLIAQV